MTKGQDSHEGSPIHIGAVRYLNSRPLTLCLAEYVPEANLRFDLPSRLADALAGARLDVALIPSIEYFRNPGYRIVSDACVACEGPVLSVKLYGRKPVGQIRSLALDEGSRTSAALAQILLAERYGLRPELVRLPIGESLGDSDADAVMLIGDRGMQPPEGPFQFVWDLGGEWSAWTGLPLVFAQWIARPGAELNDLDAKLAAARDEGLTRLQQIARIEAPRVGIAEEDCLVYLRDRLRFRFGHREREGLLTFYAMAARHGLAPTGVELAFYHQATAR